MKRPGALFTSAASATAAALTFSTDHDIQVKASAPTEQKPESSKNKSMEEAFAPRFDGLRFIETLVTAHR
ncbi:hypothetical protein SUGI_1164350 [Cryptomeria japonica]|uniref:uncharacterized protein LOC131041436 n=1 Tax=Cryptomeria japonica TaxID=3369 RepID=UPI002414890E|nr:uncharacterized protein LOC131041436 [Cryptomeria japonica]GLJ54277.1 hypothetical protein SUGI_1164350 [Cryptomeria japonica]